MHHYPFDPTPWIKPCVNCPKLARPDTSCKASKSSLPRTWKIWWIAVPIWCCCRGSNPHHYLASGFGDWKWQGRTTSSHLHLWCLHGANIQILWAMFCSIIRGSLKEMREMRETPERERESRSKHVIALAFLMIFFPPVTGTAYRLYTLIL